MAAKLLYTDKFKKECVELYLKLSWKEVYALKKDELHGITANGFRGQLDRWKNKYIDDQKILDGANLSYKSITKNATVQVDCDGNVRQAWIRTTPGENEFDIKEVLKDLKPIDRIATVGKTTNDRLMVIPFDDLHFGLAKLKDYIKVLEQTLCIIKSHRWECILVPIGADLLHVNDFNNLTSNGTYLGEFNYRQGFEDALEFYRQIFVACLDNCDNVHCYYTQGNHSASSSWDWLQVIKHLYPAVIYDDEYGFDHLRKAFMWNGVFIGLTHGDTIPKDLQKIKEIFSEEFRLPFAMATVREIYVSHLHTEIGRKDVNGCIVCRLPTGVIKGTFDKKHAYTMNNERFIISEFDHAHLKTMYYIDR